MTKPTMLAWMTCAVLSVHTLAQAQETRPAADDRASPPRAIEITPYVLMGSATASGVGAAVRWPLGSRFGLELETELRRAEITAVNLAVSLLYDLPAIGRVTPYVAGGIGLQASGKAFYRPGGEILLGSDTGLALNAGGGVRAPLTDRWGFRSDARLVYGNVHDAPSRWRIYNGATLGVGGKR
jgi:hypothetical protein